MQTASAFRPHQSPDLTRLAMYSFHGASVARAEDPDDGVSPVVFIVDPELCIHTSLDVSAATLGWQIRRFHSAQAFLDSPPVLSPCCLVLEAAMPELDVLEVQERVAIDRPGMPIVLITGGSASTTLLARPAGGVRPFGLLVGDALLVDAIARALERGRPAFSHWARTRNLRCRYDALSRREREVMALVVCGRLNKQVGGELGISEITVKAHRGSIMRKMCAASLPSLVTMAARLGMAVPEEGIA